jgi:hypothetical protein
MWNFSSRSKDGLKKVQQLKVLRVEFLAEQVGDAETELKGKFVRIFQTNMQVVLAYLVTVRYPDADQIKVALCLKHSTGKDLRLVQEIGAEFGRMFNHQESLDIMFLKPEEAERIASIARPFYRSDESDTR